MKIVVLGSGGMLGSACVRLWYGERDEIIPLDLPDFDATSPLFSRETLAAIAPQVIVNVSGIGNIDWLETRPNTARTIHTQVAANLCEAAKRLNSLLVQVSCAEVFGAANIRQTETMAAGNVDFWPVSENTVKNRSDRFPMLAESVVPEPESAFAKTKLDAERAAAEWNRHLIVRTGLLFGKKGPNSGASMVEAILAALRKVRQFKVLHDISVSPTWSDDLARGIRSLIAEHFRTPEMVNGLYHIANEGVASHLDVVTEIQKQTGIRFEITPISSAEYGFEAPRCRCCALDSAKYHSLADVYRLLPWQTALRKYLDSRNVV